MLMRTTSSRFRLIDQPVIRLFPPAGFWLQLTVLAFCLGACATKPHGPYSGFQRLEIIAATGETDIPRAASKSETAAGGAISGAMTFAPALVVSTFCMPFYVYCVQAMAPSAGLVAGTVAGGAAVGTLTGLSKEEAEGITTFFESLPASRDLNAELVGAVTGMVPAEKLSTSGGDAVLTVGIYAIEVAQDVSSRLLLRVRGSYTLAWNLDSDDPDETSRVYRCRSRLLTASEWLTDKGRPLNEAITTCVDDIAKQVNTSIARK